MLFVIVAVLVPNIHFDGFCNARKDVTKGGETVFPRLNGAPQPRDFSDCSRGLKVSPEEGKVIIFYSLLANGRIDPLSLHGACRVQEGIKVRDPVCIAQWPFEAH